MINLYRFKMSKPAQKEKKRTRGPTRIADIIKIRNQGIKLKVDFDSYGEPIRTNGKKFRTFLGYMARMKVSIIDFEDWHEVDESIREKIWQEAQVFYINDITY